MAQSPITVVATDELDKSITIAISDNSRIEYFLGDRYNWIVMKIEDWIRDEWYNYAVSQLTRNAVLIEIQRFEPPRNPCKPFPWEFKYGPSNWLDHRQNGGDITNYSTEENEMARNDKFQDTPSAEYRFTVIAPQAQSFHYHQKRRWYKTEEDAKENLATVLEDRNTPANLELAIVELVNVYKRKPKVELVSTITRGSTRSRR